jgi:HTH-type transcriptional regulator/antitoxin HigA
MRKPAKTPGKKSTKTLLELAQNEPVLDFMSRLAHVRHITNDEEHDAAITLAGHLMDLIADQPDHPLLSLLDFVADGIKEYEDKIYPPIQVSALEMLCFIMEQQGLKQKDLLPELGSQGIVSEIMNGKRELNKRQIAALSKRFNVSPALFF